MYRQFNDNNSINSNMENLNISDQELEALVKLADIKNESLYQKVYNEYQRNTMIIFEKIASNISKNHDVCEFFYNNVFKIIDQYRSSIDNVNEMLVKILDKICFTEWRYLAIYGRERISKMYLEEQDNSNAIKVLINHIQDEVFKTYSADLKFLLYIKISEVYLITSSIKDAETYINKACQLLSDIKNTEYTTEYKKICAKMTDMKCRYLEASQRYLELSLDHSNIGLSDLEMYFFRATLSAILSPASPAKCKWLNMLMKDDRSKSLPTYVVLDKMSNHKLVNLDELKSLDSYMCSYQQKEDLTNKTLIETNILSLSEIFVSISISSVANLLNISDELAEKSVADMISEERLTGTIDQVSGFIRFPKDKQFAPWDNKIEWLCNSMNSIVEKIEMKYPLWCAQQINTSSSMNVSK